MWQVTSTDGYIGGYLATGNNSVIVTGTGSFWTNSGELEVGRRAQGQLEVSGGGRVTNTSGFIGRFTGSGGTATVGGAGSTWDNSEDLFIGGDDAAR